MTVITQKGSIELAAGSAATIPFTVVTGRSLIVQVSYGNAITGITGISDSGGNTWVEDYSDTSPNGRSRKVYRCQTIGTVPTTLTVTGTAGTLVYFVYEATGLATSSPMESATPVAGVSGTSHSVSYTTVVDNDCVILASITSAARGTVTPTNGFTNVSASRTTHLSMYNQDVGTAGSKTITYTTSNTVVPDNLVIVYKTFNTDPTVSTVSSNSATEGSSITHTVTLSGATNRTTIYAATLAGVNATGSGTDFTSDLASATYSDSVTFSGGDMSVPTGVSSFTVTIATTQDISNEADETYTLTVGGVSGTGTITDDDALPTITVSDATESFSTCTFTLTLNPVSGRACSVLVETANGRKTAGTDYTGVTSTQVDFAAGETSKRVEVTVL